MLALKKVILASITILILLFGTVVYSPSYTATAQKVPDRYIIVFHDDVSPVSLANKMAKEHGLVTSHVYKSAIKGFSAIIPEGQLDKIKSDPKVRFIQQDSIVTIFKPSSPPGKGGNGGTTQPPQVIPTGIDRIDADLSNTAAIDGTDQRVDVDIAILDTGIAPHPDLNIADGINFANGNPNNWKDKNGHGTHVAGIAAALDNDIGVVGVAPGARLHAVKVLGNSGSGFLSDVIAGVDWVTAKNTNNDPTDDIEVVNMSLGGVGSDDGNCGNTNNDALHLAICNSVSSGAVYAVAAGNSATDASSQIPAAYDEVITVSALADFDGKAGGLGSATCRSDQDDTFADFSNFGADVDLIAPGVCILSTWIGEGYNTISGTSMSSPHVAGAAALYIANHPNSSPTDVKAALVSAGSSNWNNIDDRDSVKEPLVDARGL